MIQQVGQGTQWWIIKMSNIAVHVNGSDSIKYFLKDCLKAGNRYVDGSTGGSVAVKATLFSVKWTDDVANPIYDEEGKLIGYDKKVSDLTECEPGAVRDKTSKAVSEKAVKIRNKFTKSDYDKIDKEVDKIKDLDGAKKFLKKLSRAVIAISRIEDE